MADGKRNVRKKPYRLMEPITVDGDVVGWKDVGTDYYVNSGACRKAIRNMPDGTYKIMADCGTVVKETSTVERTTIKEA